MHVFGPTARGISLLIPRPIARRGGARLSWFILCAAAWLLATGHILAESGIVVGWSPSTYAARPPAELTDVVTVAAGNDTSMGLKVNGTVVVWGSRWNGDGPVIASLTDVAGISLGYNHALVVRSNGTVVAWGAYSEPHAPESVPPGLNGVIAVAAGIHHSVALKNNGTVVAWGYNVHGQLDVPADLSGVMAISASGADDAGHTLALRSNGTVVAWGDNRYGQVDVPSGLSNVIAIAAGWYHNLAVKSDGTVVQWGNAASGGSVPEGLSNVKSVSAGANHSLALKQDGTVVSWRGANGASGAEDVPVNLSNVRAIAAGREHSLAVIDRLAPFITAQPPGYTVSPLPPPEGFTVSALAGSWTDFRVRVVGSGPIAFQWQKAGVSIAGATNNELTFPNPQSADSAQYRVVVSNPFGSETSLVATLNVVPAPVRVESQPQNATTFAGGTATFSVWAVGSEPITYQWQRGFLHIPGATQSVLTLTNVQMSDAGELPGALPGYYSVKLRNEVTTDWISSAAVYLTVTNLIMAPVFASQPQSDTVFAGAKFAFSAQAGGVAPLHYQWRKNGTDLSGQTSAALNFGNAQVGDAGGYTVVVTNSFGSITSAVATLSFATRPTLSFPPSGAVVALNGAQPPPGLTNAIALASGRHDGVALRSDGTVAAWSDNGNGTSSATPVPDDWTNVVAVAAADFGNLALLADGTLRASAGSLGIGSPVPPNLYGVVAISSARKSSLALKLDGRVVSWGPAGNSMIATGVVGIAAGSFFSVVVNQDGTADVLGLPGPGNELHSAGNNIVAAAVGDKVYLLTSAGTVEALSFTVASVPEGLTNVIALSGGFSQNLALRADGTVVSWGRTNIPAILSHITAIAAGLDSFVITAWPVIVDPPHSLTVDGSTPAVFQVTAGGAGPLSYQWKKNGASIAGATSDTLTISSAQEGDAAVYTVLVSNPSGSQESLPATLSVNLFPAITRQPHSEMVFVGAKVAFDATATGAQPLSYQWIQDGDIVFGATSPHHELAGVQNTDAGIYRITVSNSFGSVTSAPALLQLGTRVVELPPPGTVVNLSGALLPPGLTNIVAIASCRSHALAARVDGTVIGWGSGITDEVQLSNVVAISVADGLGVMNSALLAGGTVVSWGNGPVTEVAGLYGVVSIAGGTRHTVALKMDGTVVTLGDGPSLPANLSNVLAVAAASDQTAVAKQDGTAEVYGFPGLGLGPLLPASNAVAVAIGDGVYALTEEGTIQGFGNSSASTPPEGLSNVVAISARGTRSLALRKDGTIAGWGALTVPPGISNVSAIAAGARYSLILTTNPPLPMLALRPPPPGGNVELAAPIAVSGFVLEATDNLALPFNVIEVFSDPDAFADPEHPVLILPQSGPGKFYRLRKL